MSNSSEKFIKQNEENFDSQDTLHEQLKKVKEDLKEELNKNSDSSKNTNDTNNPVHEYCS